MTQKNFIFYGDIVNYSFPYDISVFVFTYRTYFLCPLYAGMWNAHLGTQDSN